MEVINEEKETSMLGVTHSYQGVKVTELSGT